MSSAIGDSCIPASCNNCSVSVGSDAVASTSSNGLPKLDVIDSEKHAVKKCAKDFIFIRKIGEGSFSTVYEGKEVDTKRKFAIKVCEKNVIRKEKKVPYVVRERDVMLILNAKLHPFFVRLYCTFQDADRLYFVMTLAEHGEILYFMRRLGSFDDDVTKFYTAEIVLALEHLHSLGVIHRDLKPENILLSSTMHIMLSDFGSAKILGQEDVDRPTPLLPPTQRRASFVGTAQYVSPEVLTPNKPVTVSVDHWALGCIVYQMLSGLPPFRAATEYLIFQRVIAGQFDFPEGFKPLAKDLVEKLLVIDPSDRLGSESQGGSAAIKRHPYLNGIDWENLPFTTPPDIRPYLPATANNEEIHSNYKVPEHVEPGLDDKQLTRLLGLELADVKPITVEQTKHALDISAEERNARLAKQAKEHPYHRFVEGHIILRSGLVDKRRGLFARTRMLLLTEGPEIYYVDPSNMELKGKIPWTSDLRVEAKNFKTFFVHTPNRTYYLLDYTGHGPDWCEAIEEVRRYYYCRGSDSVCKSSTKASTSSSILGKKAA